MRGPNPNSASSWPAPSRWALPISLAVSILALALAGWGAPTPVAAAPSNVLYLAEGFTGPGFHEYLTLENSGPQAPVTITYMFPAGAAPQVVPMTLPATSRTTVDVNQVVGPGKMVSIAVDAGGSAAITAERPMYFHVCLWGGFNCAQGTATGRALSASTAWTFAEGFTGPGFQEYLTLQNPSSSATNATVVYYFDDGTSHTQSVALGASSRTTIDVNSVVGAGRAVSTVVQSGAPIIVERPMYFNIDLPGGHVDGGHVSGGTAPATSFDFAEGFTGTGFTEYLTVLNTGNAAAHVTATYYFGSGQGPPATKAYTVPAHTRFTATVNQEVGAGKTVSTHLSGDVPFVAERPMYYAIPWNSGNGGSDIAGLHAAAAWDFAEGTTQTGFDEFLTLENPNGSVASATITYYLASGGPYTQAISLPAQSRTTVRVNDVVGPNQNESARVAADQPIVAERPIYYTGCLANPSICVDLPPPTPTGISPNAGGTGGGGTASITGVNFRSPAVWIGGAAAAVTGWDSGHVNINLPGGGPGTFDLKVQNQDDGTVGVLAAGFTLTDSRQLSIPMISQVYSLSCEVAALQMALAYRGIGANQDQLLAAGSVDATAPYTDSSGLRWGDPYEAFVGDANGYGEGSSWGSHSGYGEYYPPIVKAAQAYGGGVVMAGEGISPTMVYNQVLSGHPVIAWVAYHWNPRAASSYVAFDGRRVMYTAPVEHAVTVSGVDAGSVLVNDPRGGRYWVSKGTFESSYAMLDNMAVVMN